MEKTFIEILDRIAKADPERFNKDREEMYELAAKEYAFKVATKALEDAASGLNGLPSANVFTRALIKKTKIILP